MKKKTNPTNPIYSLFKKEFTRINKGEKKIYKLQYENDQKKRDLNLMLAREILARVSDEATLAFLSSPRKDKGDKTLMEVLVSRWYWSDFGKHGYSDEYSIHSSIVVNVCKEFGLSDPDKFMNNLNVHCSDVKFSYYKKSSSGRIYLKMNFNSP